MIFIRADANEQIGTGHVMRCLSIAYAFSKRGKQVTFITADHRGDALISGFPTICLDTIWDQMDGEIEIIRSIITERKPELLLVDSYFVTERYFRELSSVVKIAYIDDLNENCWNVDFLINYNIYAIDTDYSLYKKKISKLLLGAGYAPLREEFFSMSEHRNGKVRDILVSAGGADPEHITEKIMSEISTVITDITFHFVVGALNPRLGNIENLAKGIDNIRLHVNEKHMSELMKNCDIAVSAAGSTLYELCATGTPTITYTLADNQLDAAKQFAEQGIMISVGDCRRDDNFIERLKTMLNNLIADNERRRALSEKMQKLVDGKGANRIAETILSELYISTSQDDGEK